MLSNYEKILSIPRKKKDKHNRIALLAWSKLNSNENIISKALTDAKFSDGDFTIKWLIMKQKNIVN